jgi:quercetin dioxygenase-like cupin family protein
MTRKLGVLLWAVPGLLAAVVLGSHAIPSRAVPADDPEAHTRARPLYQHALPQLDGAHLTVFLVEAKYGPGESSPPHSHPCPLIAHVVEGAFRIQIQGAPEAVYKTGESFYEAPNDVHQVSANASDKEPARLLAYFVCDHETSLSVPVAPNGGSSGGSQR